MNWNLTPIAPRLPSILQVLSLSLFEVKPLDELLGTLAQTDDIVPSALQSCLFPEISGQ